MCYLGIWYPATGKVYSLDIYLKRFLTDLGQIGSFLWVRQFSPPITEISKWVGTWYFYPSEIVYSTGRNYWTPKIIGGPMACGQWFLCLDSGNFKTTSPIGLWNIFHKKLMITSIAEFSHSSQTTAFSHDQVDGIFPVLRITLPEKLFFVKTKDGLNLHFCTIKTVINCIFVHVLEKKPNEIREH